MVDEFETLPVAKSNETFTPKKILIVEDDPDQVEALSFRLRQQGYNVFNALNGADGIQRAQNERPDLVLLDLNLPDQASLDVCAKLADDPNTCGTPVIVVSGQDSPNIVCETRAAGCEFYVRKPYDPNALLTLIQAALDQNASW
jgi:two-component system alkaline phosphatase synthesis response regulator PhoP